MIKNGEQGVPARRLIAAARKRLARNSDAVGRRGDEDLQARELLGYATDGEFDDEDVIDPPTRRRFDRLIERRLTGEPVAYIRGFEEFRRLRLSVKPRAFVPRQPTEYLADQAIRRLRTRRAPLAADLATGIGGVALSLALEVPAARVF